MIVDDLKKRFFLTEERLRFERLPVVRFFALVFFDEPAFNLVDFAVVFLLGDVFFLVDGINWELNKKSKMKNHSAQILLVSIIYYPDRIYC